MLALGSLAFASPWLLAALAALPVIWWLLRVTPPAPRRIAFPAIRAAARAAAARGDAGADAALADPAAHGAGGAGDPGPRPSAAQPAGRASPATGRWCWWSMTAGRRRATGPRGRPRPTDLLAEAEREGRKVVLVTTAPLAAGEPPPPLAPIRAADARAAVQALQPKPWPVDRKARAGAAAGAAAAAGHASSTSGSSDGIERRRRPGARRLSRRPRQRCAMSRAEDAERRAAARRRRRRELAARMSASRVRSLPAPAPRPFMVRASGEDGALLARQRGDDRAGGDSSVAVRLAMPTELRNRIDPHRDRGRAIGRRGAAARRALAPPAGRHRRRAEHRRPAAAQRELLSRAGARRRSPKCAAAAPTIC